MFDTAECWLPAHSFAHNSLQFPWNSLKIRSNCRYTKDLFIGYWLKYWLIDWKMLWAIMSDNLAPSAAAAVAAAVAAAAVGVPIFSRPPVNGFSWNFHRLCVLLRVRCAQRIGPVAWNLFVLWAKNEEKFAFNIATGAKVLFSVLIMTIHQKIWNFLAGRKRGTYRFKSYNYLILVSYERYKPAIIRRRYGGLLSWAPLCAHGVVC